MQTMKKLRVVSLRAQEYPFAAQALVGTLAFRQYRHSLNPDGSIKSHCTKCNAMVASGKDEWLLLDCEQSHICGQ
jgi:hypothetical protein